MQKQILVFCGKAIILSGYLIGCCLPILGPCGLEQYVYGGASKGNSVLIETIETEQEPFGTARVFGIKPESDREAPRNLPRPTSLVYLPPGAYRFHVFGTWERIPKTMGPAPVACYHPLKTGHYYVRALRQFDTNGVPWFAAVIQDSETAEVVCLSSPLEAGPVPEWVKTALKEFPLPTKEP